MIKASIETNADYPKLIKLLVILGWIGLIAISLTNRELVILIGIMFGLSFPVTLIVAIRCEQLSYSAEFKRSWIDWILENANSYFLLAGIGVLIYGFLQGVVFGLGAGLLFIIVISLSMDASWKLAAKVPFSNDT